MATNNAINGVIGSMITKYTASNTWTKNVNTQMVEIIVWNSGAGGGSGRQATSTTSGGGAGGAAGCMVTWYGSAKLLGSTETVTIANGGAGGLTQGSNNSSGNTGGPSAFSSIGNIAIESVTTVTPGGSTGTVAGVGSGQSYFWNAPLAANLVTNNAGGSGTITVGGTKGAQYIAGTSATFFVYCQQLPNAGGGGGGADTGTIRSGGVGGNIVFGTSVASSSGVTVVYAGGKARK